MKNRFTPYRSAGFSRAEIITVLALIGLLAALPLPKAHAGLQTQLTTNALPVSSTNTFIIPGDVTGAFTNGSLIAGPNTFIDGSKATALYGAVGGYFTNSTANASNITYRIASSVDLVNWTNNAQAVTLIVPAATTNWCVTLFPISAAFPGYALRTVENANVANVAGRPNTIYFKAFTKTGL